MLATHPDKAAVDPTERSKPPPMMTKVMPMAITAMIEDCTRMLVRLSGDRNRLVSSAVARQSTIKVRRGICPARFSRRTRAKPAAIAVAELAPSPCGASAASGEDWPSGDSEFGSLISSADRGPQLRLVEAVAAFQARRDPARTHGEHTVAQMGELAEIARAQQGAAAAPDEI